MKKLLFVLMFVPLVSCSSDDDTNRTTDPIIGNWICDSCLVDNRYSLSATAAFNSNGSYATTYNLPEGDGGEGVSGSQRGTWENLGSDLNALSQVYKVKETSESGDQDDIVTFTFTENFNEFTTDGLTYIRQ
jgi:hypothetical protein|tara:strand:- start:586 stop:981 length:396 start_codon:yes stop_codon:yes gene_type:complete